MSEDTVRRDGLEPVWTVALIVGAAAIISAIVALILDPQAIGGMGRGMGRGMHTFDLVIQIRLFLSTFNVLLLLVLTWSYLVVYRDLPNRFTFSLLLFSVALLFYAVASNPAIHVLFGYRGGPGLGPFAFLPDLFAAVAVTVLLYQSFQ
ncbi:MAG: hypothetical protein ABEJ58_05710 [Halodesulfurarchaeum sp.]